MRQLQWALELQSLLCRIPPNYWADLFAPLFNLKLQPQPWWKQWLSPNCGPSEGLNFHCREVEKGAGRHSGHIFNYTWWVIKTSPPILTPDLWPHSSLPIGYFPFRISSLLPSWWCRRREESILLHKLYPSRTVSCCRYDRNSFYHPRRDRLLCSIKTRSSRNRNMKQYSWSSASRMIRSKISLTFLSNQCFLTKLVRRLKKDNK